MRLQWEWEECWTWDSVYICLLINIWKFRICNLTKHTRSSTSPCFIWGKDGSKFRSCISNLEWLITWLFTFTVDLNSPFVKVVVFGPGKSKIERCSLNVSLLCTCCRLWIYLLSVRPHVKASGLCCHADVIVSYCSVCCVYKMYKCKKKKRKSNRFHCIQESVKKNMTSHNGGFPFSQRHFSDWRDLLLDRTLTLDQ